MAERVGNSGADCRVVGGAAAAGGGRGGNPVVEAREKPTGDGRTGPAVEEKGAELGGTPIIRSPLRGPLLGAGVRLLPGCIPVAG